MNFKQVNSQTNTDENQIIMDLDRRDFINWIPVTVLITLVIAVYLYRQYRIIKK